jgi:hypothetical protein
LALVWSEQKRADWAHEAIARLVRTFPARPPSVRQIGPEGVALYTRVRAELDRAPRGRLTVQKHPVDAVVWVDGAPAGSVSNDLYGGEHRVQIVSGSARSRVHHVQITSGGVQVVDIDLDYDRALRTEPDAALEVGPTTQALSYAARLARELGAERAIVLTRLGRSVEWTLVDAEAGSVVRRGTVSEQPMANLVHLVGGELPRPQADRAPPPPAQPARKLPWFILAGAGAAVAAGVALWASAQSDYDDLERRHPTGVIDPMDVGLRDDGHTKAVVGDVLVGVGVAAAAAAIYLVVRDRPRHVGWTGTRVALEF